MTGTVTKGQIQRGDLALFDGVSLSASRTDSTGGTKTGLRIGDSVDVLTVYGSGTSYTGGAVQQAIRAIGSATRMISLAPGTWVFSSNLTIPTNVSLYLAAGASLEPAVGVTLTIAGPLFRHSTTYTGGAGTVTVTGKDNMAASTLQTIWLPASCWVSRTTSGAASGLSEMTTNKNMVRTFDFDSTSIEYIQTTIQMPKSWDEGTLTWQIVWTASSGSGTVAWKCQAVATSEGDTLDVAFGTAIEVDDTLTTALDNHTTDVSAAMTAAGTPAEKDLLNIQLYRDPTDAADNFSADAKFIGMQLLYGVNALGDA